MAVVRGALRLAHRGDHRRHLENTIAALEAGLSVAGCDGLEFDVRASADGIPILLHDETLWRVFGREQAGLDLDAAGLAAIGLPTLAEALAVARLPAFLDVELKEDVVERSVSVLASARGDPPARAVLSSFQAGILRRVGEVAPGWPTWLNTRELSVATISMARELGCVGVSVQWRAIDASTMRLARDAGLAVAAWTVTRRATADRLDRLGVAAICVEGPALARG